MKVSEEPFPDALRELMAERGISSIRELARRTRAEVGWGSHTAIRAFQTGRIALTVDGMEAIAKVTRVSPHYFAEYRLAVARRELDPNQVGFARALENLEDSPRLAQRAADPSPFYPRAGRRAQRKTEAA